jgi:hypothetical protein
MSVTDRPLRPQNDVSLTLSRSEAVVAVLVGCVAVDGVLRAEEAGRLNEMLSSTRWVLGTGVQATAGVTRRALEA